MTQRRLSDWELPQGVDRPLCEYLQSRSIADDYDQAFAATNLLQTDVAYLQSHFQIPGTLIDLGCGTGRILVTFAQQGFKVVGIDLSLPMLNVVSHKRSQLGLPIHLIQANLCELDVVRPASFDYACCMFSTLGMIVGQSERLSALQQVYRLLKPNGLFGLHVHNLWYNWTDPVGRRWLMKDVVRQLLRKSDAGDKVQPQYRGIPNLRLHLFRSKEIVSLLGKAGFELIDQTPLSPDRTGKVRDGWLAPIRTNGWLLMTRKPSNPSH